MYRETPYHWWTGPFAYGVYRFVIKHTTGADSWNEVVLAIWRNGIGEWTFSLDEEDTIIKAPDLDAAMQHAEKVYSECLLARIAEMQAIVDTLF